MKNFIMKKSFLWLIVVMVLIPAALTFGKGEAEDGGAAEEKAEIVYWTHENPAYVSFAESLVEEFNKSGDVVVTHEYFSDFNTKVYSSFATGVEADIMEMYGGVLRFAMGGSILPVPDDVMSISEIENTYWESTLKNRFYNGKYYGLPEELNLESPGLLINPELINKAGMEIPQSWEDNLGPESFSELLNFARDLTVIEGDVMKQAGLGVVGGEEAAMFLSLIWQLGGEYKEPENREVNFTTPEAKRAVEFILNLIEGPNRVHSTKFSGRMGGFQEGTIAMTIGAPWYAAVYNQEVPGLEYEYYNLPPFIEGSEPFFVGEGGWGPIVSARTENPEATWKFFSFMMNKENQMEWAKKVGSIPARKDLEDAPYFTSGEGQKVFYPALQIAQYGIDPGAYTIDPYQFVWDIVYRNLDAMIHREISIDEGLQAIEQETNSMIKKMYER